MRDLTECCRPTPPATTNNTELLDGGHGIVCSREFSVNVKEKAVHNSIQQGYFRINSIDLYTPI